jgi:ABC-type sulfate transport system permease subunit
VGDGVFSGLIGASAVALWFLVVDTALREAFFTPSLVASALLRGEPPVADHAVDLTMVAAFTAIHSFLFILFGIAASWVVDQFQHTPDLPLITIGTFLALEGGFVIATKLFVPDLAETIGHGLIVAGNVFAAIGMGLWLRGLQRHPEDLAAATPR